MNDRTVTLVTGGARSGKSRWAERHARESGRPVVYVATASPGDPEMAARIAAHRAARPTTWQTVEERTAIAAVVRAHARPGDLVLVDCLTLWVSNLLTGSAERHVVDDHVSPEHQREIEQRAVAAAEEVLNAAREVGASLVLVTNEVGLGIVPATPLGRLYRDVLGRVNQAVASRADAVILMVAGIAVDLRRLGLILDQVRSG